MERNKQFKSVTFSYRFLKYKKIDLPLPVLSNKSSILKLVHNIQIKEVYLGLS